MYMYITVLINQIHLIYIVEVSRYRHGQCCCDIGVLSSVLPQSLLPDRMWCALIEL